SSDLLINIAHTTRAKVAGDLVVRELGSDHDVTKSVSDSIKYHSSPHVFEAGRREARERRVKLTYYSFERPSDTPGDLSLHASGCPENDLDELVHSDHDR